MAKSSAENHQPQSNPYIHEPNFNPIRHFIDTLLKCNNLDQIKQVHARIAIYGMFHNLIVINKLLYLYAYSRSLKDAHALFDVMKERDAVTWSVMIGGFAKVRDYFNCFKTFRDYIRSGLVPDNYTLPSVIRACRDDKCIRFGKLIHQISFKFGLESDEFIAAALVDMYANCDVIDDARQLFDKMPKRDLTTWTVMVSAFAKSGNPSESLVLFDSMIDEGFVLDKIAMVTVVNACAKTGAMNKARLVHDYLLWRNFSIDVILGSAIIDMFAKCGNVDYARVIFNGMNRKNVVTFSTMIAAYGYHGRGKEALDLFMLMLRSNVAPNGVTFVSLLYACSHGGLVEDGLRIFDSMSVDYSITPDVKHYTCMVDLLGRAGRVSEAFELIEKMTIEKDEGLFGALLGACRIHGEVELAEKAVKSLVEFDNRNPSHYVLLSNIYARAGKWREMAGIREVITRLKLKKVPGWTWVEVGNVVYRFGVGDWTHVESKRIYDKLRILGEKIELVGYVPNTDFVLHDVDEEVKVGMLYAHSEKLAIAFGLLSANEGSSPIRLTKNLRVCGDCHTFCKFVSRVERRVIVLRDAKRFHHFRDGVCSCGDYW
ncbi:pentatricopeptide repeat-containing protein At2g33760-like [Impatiens glandulifera]|uniref:pentatricopeptide repeat-containing protein At2g33760-like n=1 Tax=Impatiens glandulifera TaxID=253017 RepID=UPI001FB16102|nr:pentatricopeptide repeat-containing protein At2g33760-like [Impatiens glandulifera]